MQVWWLHSFKYAEYLLAAHLAALKRNGNLREQRLSSTRAIELRNDGPYLGRSLPRQP